VRTDMFEQRESRDVPYLPARRLAVEHRAWAAFSWFPARELAVRGTGTTLSI